METQQKTWESIRFYLSKSKVLDAFISGKKHAISPLELEPIAKLQLIRCDSVFLEYRKTMKVDDLSDHELLSFVRYTDGLPLWDFRSSLRLVPALVNVVSVRMSPRTAYTFLRVKHTLFALSVGRRNSYVWGNSTLQPERDRKESRRCSLLCTKAIYGGAVGI